MRFSDPGHLALRRGIRAAIALPLTLALSIYTFDDVSGSLFAVFGIVGLLINADFAGRLPARVMSYLVTGIVGTVLIAVGWAASFNTAAAAFTTVVVAFLLGFLNFLRGRVAVGTSAVLLIFVVSVCVDAQAGDLRRYVLGWWIAVIVSTVTAALVLPRDTHSGQRSGLADAFDAAARGVRTTWATKDPALNGFGDFAKAVEALDAGYGGQPFRSSGMTAHDQALTLLIDHVNSAHLLLADSAHLPVREDAVPLPSRAVLIDALAASLDELARAMREPSFIPSAADLDVARAHLLDGMRKWVRESSTSGVAPAQIEARLGADHHLRMAAIVTEQMVELARLVNGATIEDLDRLPPVPRVKRRVFVRSEFHLGSPWFRNAARSALGLGLAVLVVNITGAQHGFWVLLGVISILRFDAVGTRRYALQAVVGTIAGVVVASLILAVPGLHSWVLWSLLPVMVFLAAWSAVAISYPVGQAAFSALVLFALAIIDWPPQMQTGLFRVEDIALGAAVAFVVAILMWPRGAIGALRQEAAQAIRQASAYLSAVLDSYVNPTPADVLEQSRQIAIRAAYRASETYDMALMQRGPARDMRQWTAITSTLYVLISAARVVSQFATTQAVLGSYPELAAGVTTARGVSSTHWSAVADAVARTNEDTPFTPPNPSPECPYPAPEVISDAEAANAVVVTVWSIDWVNHLNRLGASARSASPGGGAGTSA